MSEENFQLNTAGEPGCLATGIDRRMCIDKMPYNLMVMLKKYNLTSKVILIKNNQAGKSWKNRDATPSIISVMEAHRIQGPLFYYERISRRKRRPRMVPR